MSFLKMFSLHNNYRLSQKLQLFCIRTYGQNQSTAREGQWSQYKAMKKAWSYSLVDHSQ